MEVTGLIPVLNWSNYEFTLNPPVYKNAEQEDSIIFSLLISTLQLEVSRGYKQRGQKS